MNIFLTKYIKNYLDIYQFAHTIYDIIRTIEYAVIYMIFRPFPLKNKIVASSFNGKKYGDNTKFIVEQIHKLNPNIEIIWFCDPKYSYKVPEYIHLIKCSCDEKKIKRAFHYYTAKVWIDTHLYDKYLRKRKGQLVIETWHGGLGIKKIEGDVEKFSENKFQIQKIKNTSKITDIYTSNSDFLSQIYRRAFFYNGVIWKVGFPKNDLLLKDNIKYKKKVYNWFNLVKETHIIIYAPTYRGEFEDNGILNMNPYNIDLNQVVHALECYWGGKWVALVRWHPSMIKAVKGLYQYYSNSVIDASSYPEMQEIIAASDAFISDYSSSIFDAALRKIPCLIYANDYNNYMGDRGAYFKLEQLPFPCARDMSEMISCICTYDSKLILEKWNRFCKETGLYENGTATRKIAVAITDYIINDGALINTILKSNN